MGKVLLWENIAKNYKLHSYAMSILETTILTVINYRLISQAL